MRIFKKWLQIMLIVMLTFSCISPSISVHAETQTVYENENIDVLTGLITADEEPIQALEDATANEPEVATSLVLSEQGQLTLTKNQTHQLAATILPHNTTNDSATIEWTSKNESIVTVTENGVVTAINEGTTEIQAAVGDIISSISIIVETPSLSTVLTQQLQIKSDFLWNLAEPQASLNYERILSLWQSGYVDRNELKKKAQPNILGETVSNYTNAVMLLAASQSNPFAYDGKNFASKLSNAQTGEGYFSFSEPSSYNNDRKADTFVKALFAVEFIGAEYNRETAFNHLKSLLPDIKSQTNGVLLGLTVSVLAHYDLAEAQTMREELLMHYKESGVYFTQGLGLYVDNLYALGEDPLDEKWYIKINDQQYVSAQEAYSKLIHTNENYVFYNRLKANELIGQSNETAANSHWSLIGLVSLVNGKSMISDAKQQFANLNFDFSPKKIEVTNITQPYLLKGTTIKPIFVIKDQYHSPRTATVQLQSSNPAVLAVNEKNELIALQAGQAVITVTVEGYEHVRKVLSFTVTEHVQLTELLPKIEKAIGHLTRQDKMSSFEDTTALKTFGYNQEKLSTMLNIYSVVSPSNAARNILTLTAAGLNPYTYNGVNYVETLHHQIDATHKLSAIDAVNIVMAQYVLGEIPNDKVTHALLAESVEKDNLMYLENLGSPDIQRTGKLLYAITLLNSEQMVTENAEVFLEAENKLLAFFQANFSNGKFNSQSEQNAVAVLNYLSLKQQTVFGNFDAFELATMILQNQYNNAFITNGMIPNLSGLQSESTGIGLNAISFLLTDHNAYKNLKKKETAKPTTIKLEFPDKAKKNVPLELKGQLLDQNGNYIDSTITWTVNGSVVTDSYLPNAVGLLQIQAEAQGIIAEKTIEIIDYQKIYSVTINAPKEAVTDIDLPLTAIVKDSEDVEVTDVKISWKVEGSEALVNGAAVRFLKPSKYVITAEAEGVKARAIEIDVALNTDSIQTQVAQAVEHMKQYLINKGQYDYISALAYNKVVNDPTFSQKQMRTIGHLREYGNHDQKYALYYAKNILQAVAASENPKHFTTYKGPVVDLVTPLVTSQDTDGHFTMFTNFDKSSVATQAWSIIALDLINEPYNIELAVQDLLNGLNGALSEGSYKEQELRALALIALSKHRDIEGVNQQISSILNYLKVQQNTDGGFNYGGYTNNPFAIGTVIQGLIAVGENPFDAKWKKNGRTMVEALLSQQIKNGGFKFGDEFEAETEFDELKSTEAAFGALADLYTKSSMFNESIKMIGQLPEVNNSVKPFIEITNLELQQSQPLLSVSVTAYDNIDGELTPTVTINNTPVYSVDNNYKAVVKQGVNTLRITTENSLGNETVEVIPVLFQNIIAQSVPQATVTVIGLNGAQMYTNKAIIEENDTAYSVLVKAIGKHNIVARFSKNGVYISSINNLKEFDHGNGSGWMYRVNGIFPNVFAGDVNLQDGDTLEWIYTADLGKDIGSTMPTTPIIGDNSTVPNESTKPEDIDKQPVVDSNKENIQPVAPIENNNQDIIVVDHENLQTTINIEDAQKILEENKSTVLTIKNSIGTTVELPKSLFTSSEMNDKFNISVDENNRDNEHVIHVKMEINTNDGSIKNVITGKEYIKITIPLKEVQEHTVVVQRINGELKAVPHIIKDGQLTIYTKTSGEFIITTQQITFKDISLLEYKEDIEFLASRHVIKGVNREEYAPFRPITRAQFGVMIARALGLQASDSQTSFKDTNGKWYEHEIQALLEAEITTGKTVNTFDPEGYVTRQQAAAFMGRILEYLQYDAPTGKAHHFKDAHQISPEFEAYINMLSSLNIMTGKKDGTFDATGQLTRAQMAKILKRTLTTGGIM